MNNTELDISRLLSCIESLKKCYQDLKEVTDSKFQEYVEDACIKRFEYTVEISWKIMKRFLKLQYGKIDKELTMNNIFRLMEGYEFISSWEKWRDYYNKINDTSHEYNQNKAKIILNSIEDLIADSQYLYDKLNKVIKND
ncbi:MAG: HI0074 family nucleotidyltransferase substrate-binding subunit [Candidatus Gastranaerophilales bacterium]|nr:HI0074 family nucleotidyltransferase substrate-binding subunit [Candidatus Gastranaerophilales bacterium]